MNPVVAIAIALAQLAPSADAPKADAAALEKMAVDILRDLEEMRGQTLAKPLKTGVKDKPQVTAFINERLAEEYGPAKVAAEGRMLKLMGLLPEPMDYGKFLVSLMTEQVAGFYDHTRQELHIAAWLPAMMQPSVMAHEIFHAIQDQEWGGGKLIDSKVYSPDAVLAHAALLEGDATIMMFDWQQSAAGLKTDMATSKAAVLGVAASLPMQMASPQFPVMAVAPDYLKQSMIFPYQQGLLFVGALRQSGMSWDDVRGVYADPPASTEQILHPERYIERDPPSVVELPSPLVAGFSRTWDGAAGEFHHRQLLLPFMSTPEAIAGASGWDGDMTVLEVDGQRGYAVIRSTWDSAEAAKGWVEAIQKAHGKRKAPAPTLAVRHAGTEVGLAWSKDPALAQQALDAAMKTAKVERR